MIASFDRLRAALEQLKSASACLMLRRDSKCHSDPSFLLGADVAEGICASSDQSDVSLNGLLLRLQYLFVNSLGSISLPRRG